MRLLGTWKETFFTLTESWAGEKQPQWPPGLSSSFCALVPHCGGREADNTLRRWAWNTAYADVSFSFSMCLTQGRSGEASMCPGLPAAMSILKQFFYLVPGLGFGNPEAKSWLHCSLHSALSPFPEEVNEECPSCWG